MRKTNDDLSNKYERFADIIFLWSGRRSKNGATLPEATKIYEEKKTKLEIMFPGSLERRLASVFPSL